MIVVGNPIVPSNLGDGYYRETFVVPCKADFFPKGQRDLLPEFTIDFKEDAKPN